MPKRKYIKEKTTRILQLYHLFITCAEVSREEIDRGIYGKRNEETGRSESWNTRTISRDIAILKQAGLPILYSGKRKAYILHNEPEDAAPKKSRRCSPMSNIGKGEQRYIDKIKRLTMFIKRLRSIHSYDDDEDGSQPCERHYKEMFPNVSKRTMQRDFSELREVNYVIEYKRKWRETPAERTWVDEFDGEVITEYEPPIGHYYLWDFIPDPYL